jgi:hypothetical protein
MSCLLLAFSPVNLRNLTRYPDSFVDNYLWTSRHLEAQANNLLVYLLARARFIRNITGTPVAFSTGCPKDSDETREKESTV